MIRPTIKQAIQTIKANDYLVITTGAGIGVDYGMPDYRGDKGFWNSYPPYTNKFTFIQCANPAFLIKHPNLFWGFYGVRLKLYRNTKPEQGYNILKKIAESKKDYFGVTSNVDGHLVQFLGDKAYEMHGSIHYNQCIKCDYFSDNKWYQPNINLQQMSCDNLPKCSKCKGLQRPNILMFGDAGWDSSRSDQQQERYIQFIDKTKYGKTTIIEIGAGNSGPSVRYMSQSVLRNNKNNRLIRINPEQEQNISHSIISIKSGGLAVLKQIQKNY